MKVARVVLLGSLAIVAVAAVLVLFSMDQKRKRLELLFARETSGSITYDCSTRSGSVDFRRDTIGPIELRLTADRQPGTSTVWTVRYPDGNVIPARGFQLKNNSIGGSQGLRWRMPDGTQNFAELRFSDLIGDYGPETVWLTVVRSKGPGLGYTCGPDSRSYRAA